MRSEMAVCGVLMAAGMAMGQTNLVSNGRFDGVIDKRAAAWTWGDPQFVSLQEENGNRFFRIQQPQAGGANITQEVALDPAWKKIQATAKLRGKGIQPGKQAWNTGCVQFTFTDAGGKQVGGWPKLIIAKDQDWTLQTLTEEIPAGAAKMTVSLANWGGAGTFDFDDVRFTPLDAAGKPMRRALQAYNFNYGEALQKSLYFYECQESGQLSPLNRVAWRGPSCLDDGKDVGRDLSGGWYDAGDHWKANFTMSFAAALQAWSAVQYPDAYTKTGQMPYLLNGLKHVNDYFLRCIVDPAPSELQKLDGYELYIDVGGKPGPEPGVHAVWCAPEVLDGFTVREALKVNAQVPGPDVAGSQSAAMAASAMVFYQHGDKAYARQLLDRSEKLLAFAVANPKLAPDEAAIDPKGKARKIEYRSGKVDQILIWASAWQHRARTLVLGNAYDGHYFADAARRYDAYKWDWGHVDFFGGQYDLANSMLLMQIAPADPKATKWEADLRRNLDLWENLEPTPYGFKIRPVYGGWFTLKWAMGQVALATMYSDWTKDPEQQKRFRDYAQSQIDYVLGANKYGKSYQIGFGQDWFRTPHHRGATGAWHAFDHFNANSPYYLKEVRHTLYGAMLAGMDQEDNRTDDMMKHYQNEVALDFNAPWQIALAGFVAKDPVKYQPIPADQFPPKIQKNLSLDPNHTDREYFVVATVDKQTDTGVTITGAIHNQSQWPPRITPDLSFHYYLTLDGGATPDDLQATVEGGGAKLTGIRRLAGDLCEIEVGFPGQGLAPNYIWKSNPEEKYRRTFTLKIQAPAAAKWSTDNDFSFPTGPAAIRPRIPVYETGKLLEGERPQ